MAGQTIGKVVAGGKTHTVTSTFYGTCATAANTAAKEVIINEPNTTETLTFINGMTLSVKFTNTNLATNPTLTCFNNSGTAASPTKGSTTLLAAKSIKRYGTTSAGSDSANSWQAGQIVNFVYDGTNWIAISEMDETLNNLNMFRGTKSIGFGDSNMAGTYFDTEYESTRHQCIYGQICDVLGCEYDNRGVNGAHFDTNPNNVDLTKSAHAIMEQIDAANADPDVKLIVFVGGINDFHYATINYNQFISSVTACASAAMNKFPNAAVILIWDQGQQDPNHVMLRYARGIRVVASNLSTSYNKRIVAPFTSDLFMEISNNYYNQNHFNPNGAGVIARRAIRALFGLSEVTMTKRRVVNPQSGFSHCLAIVKTDIDPTTYVRTDNIEVFFDPSFAYSGGSNIANNTPIFNLPFGFDSNLASSSRTLYDCLHAYQGSNNAVNVEHIPIWITQSDSNFSSVTASPTVEFKVLYQTAVSKINSHRTTFRWQNVMDPRS